MHVLPQHHVPPFFAPKLKGTIAIGTFVIVKDEVYRVVDQLDRPFVALHCNAFRPVKAPKHGPTVNGLGRGLVELVWCSGLIEIRPQDIDDIAFEIMAVCERAKDRVQR